MKRCWFLLFIFEVFVLLCYFTAISYCSKMYDFITYLLFQVFSYVFRCRMRQQSNAKSPSIVTGTSSEHRP